MPFASEDKLWSRKGRWVSREWARLESKWWMRCASVPGSRHPDPKPMTRETTRVFLKKTNFYRLFASGLNKIGNFSLVIIWDPFGVKEWIGGVGDKRCRRREGNIFTRSHLRGWIFYLLPGLVKPTPELLNRIPPKWQKLHQTPRIPPTLSFFSSVTLSIPPLYLRNQEWYHRSAGVKTTGRKILK